MFIIPNWPAPKHIKSICTTRQGGVSQPPFDSFNIATHVGDDVNDVITNRQRLVQQACLPSEPVWLDQQHTDRAIELSTSLLRDAKQPEVADASWTTEQNMVSVVMTADCLPILITNKNGTLVSAIHAGWKGLQKGIVSTTITEFVNRGDCQSQELMVWIGPAISVKHFEVGAEVRESFIERCASNSDYFQLREMGAGEGQKYLADLVGLVTKELNDLGVKEVYGGDLCSFSQEELFYSYRRSGQTGRMATMIWIEA